jgi:hypothetical protein
MCNTQHTTQGKKMNAYSLRASILSQAQDILSSQYHQEYERLRYLCDRDQVDPKTVNWPKMPTTEKILEEAEKLYKFIQTK